MLKTSNDQRKLLPNFDQLFATTAQAPGGVARLRELILTLAVQGRLVAQDASDEPASELLKKIRVEKDRLIAEGKIKKDKPLAEIAKEEKPFELPVGWEWARVSDVAFSQAGFAFKSSGFNSLNAGLPLIRIRDVGFNSPETYFSGEYREEFLVASGDWLISMDGEFRVRKWEGSEALLNQRVSRLIFYFDNLPTSFIATALQFEIAKLQGTKAYTTVDHLSGSQISNALLPFPPLAEQSRIVARVEELMRLCDTLEEKGRLEHTQHQQLLQAMLDSLTQTQSAQELARHWQRLAHHFDLLIDRPEAVDALEQTILQLAVRGLLVEQDASEEPASELLKKIRAEKDRLITEGKIKKDKKTSLNDKSVKPFPLPNGWVWASFPELGEFGRGKSKHRPRNDPQLFDPPIYPLIQTGEVARAKRIINEVHSKYSDFGLAQSRLWPKGTLCITIAANIADAAILGFDACFPDSVVGFIPFSEKETTNYYLAFMETAKAEISAYAPATAQKNINLEILESIRIPIPPLAEQSRIVARVTELRALCQRLRDKLTQARRTQTQLAQAWVEQAAA
ncbi:restriction endonuclease subunit S [Comamonas thiooxydans]|uniref:Restriction endonuclease subunit S n=1 Tax=Comamonas thiooxydans TaxID=363952 RepID=A0AA42Q114_9BURK|nr:restriction endonuclease subunit S [Comamonas thiooxydans]MDH1335170.1 restriction endonuclease subunit S [Comamonas thiooxydans]MDH1475690.1 restriction endonuclease subunit S [Comamonas thiooxydans]MDH1740648.1 restriction endonuclease subunit S [Comamonas thiooxydans]MDH1786876.1 restriction endonuclease subunit S [Comamonas thiooxydans]